MKFGIEQEKKFNVVTSEFLKCIDNADFDHFKIEQYIILEDGKNKIRVRSVESNSTVTYFLTIKENEDIFYRLEYEIEIPKGIFDSLVKSAIYCINKTRYIIPYENEDNFCWEVDIFEDGSMLAEMELPEGKENFPSTIIYPSWISEERL